MILQDSSGAEFQLVILGYQHPDVHEDRWDSNWLVVNGTVRDRSGGTWRFSAPCVTTFELAALADWIEELASDGRHPSSFEFAEPNLKFSYSPWPRRLQLTLSAGSGRPADRGADSATEAMLEFALPDTAARELAGQIRDLLVDYPVRGGAA